MIWLLLAGVVGSCFALLALLEALVDLLERLVPCEVGHLAGVAAGASGGAATPGENAGQVDGCFLQAGVVAPPEGSTGGTRRG